MFEQNDIYQELWNPQPLKIRLSSRLFSLKPIGVGTPNTESISSYLCRLAYEHCVPLQKLVTEELSSLLIDRKIEPNLTNMRFSSIFGNSDAKPAINGMRDMTRSLTFALESLTLRQDIKYLSFLTYQGIIKDKGLFKQHKAWCPQCLEARRQKNKPLYEPLIWSFKDVNYCSQHHCRLVDRCLSCDSQFKAINNNSIIGFCSKCKKWLGNKSNLFVNISDRAVSSSQRVHDLTTIEGIESLIKVAFKLDYQLTLSDAMRKLQLIHFCFERVVRQDITQLIALGKVMEQLKITFTSHYDKPLDLVKLLIPVCNAANISVASFFIEDFQSLGDILVSNLEINCKF